MKSILTILALIASLVLGNAQAGPGTNNAAFAWTPSSSVFVGPTNVTMPPDGYVMWVTTNLSTSLTNWTRWTNIPTTTVSGTNFVATTNWTVTGLPESPIFAVMTYTNAFGVSPFSNVAGAQAKPSDPRIIYLRPIP